MARLFVGVLRNGKYWRDVKATCLPVRDSGSCIQCLDTTNCLLQRAETKQCKVLTNLFGDVLKKVDNKFWFAVKSFS